MSEPKPGSAASSPSAALGLLCHEVLAKAALGALGTLDPEAGWRTKFDQQWDELVREFAEECPVAPQRWPGLNSRKAAARRLARQVSEEYETGAELLPEQNLSAYAGELAGRADLVVRAPVHEVRDYKTGPIHDAQGEVRSEYVRQLLIYAFLEAEQTGSWPDHVVLVPFRGPKVTIAVAERTHEARNEADKALAALRDYNSAHDAGADPWSLARPGPGPCMYCDYAPRCQPFWETAVPEWAEAGVHAAAGRVREVRVAQSGGRAVELDALAGTLSAERVTITPVDPAEFPGVNGLAPEALAAFTGLRPRGELFAEPGLWAGAAWTQ